MPHAATGISGASAILATSVGTGFMAIETIGAAREQGQVQPEHIFVRFDKIHQGREGVAAEPGMNRLRQLAEIPLGGVR